MSNESADYKTNTAVDFKLLMIEGGMTPSRIKKIRKKYGMNQSDFAALLEVKYPTFCSWEIGARNPSSPSCALLQIAEKHPTIFLQNRYEIIKNIMLYFSKKL